METLNFFRNTVEKAIDSLVNDGVFDTRPDVSRIVIEIPRDASHGDITTNAAMILSKEARMKPRDLAEIILKKLSNLDAVQESEIAGPGFINLRLTADFWQDQLTEILKTGTLISFERRHRKSISK